MEPEWRPEVLERRPPGDNEKLLLHLSTDSMPLACEVNDMLDAVGRLESILHLRGGDAS
jgi:hypothetical protein